MIVSSASKEADPPKAERFGSTDKYDFTIRGKGRWFTNIDHGWRREPLQLMTDGDNLRYNKKLITSCRCLGLSGLRHLLRAIEVPWIDFHPQRLRRDHGCSDHVPRQVQPDQFEILPRRRYGQTGPMAGPAWETSSRPTPQGQSAATAVVGTVSLSSPRPYGPWQSPS